MQPTPSPDVNAVLGELLSGARVVLGDHFVGLYLYGSLASGDFDPRCSDIDFVVVTADVLPEETVAALEAMHARMQAHKWAAKLEGAYVPLRALRRHDPDGAPCPCVNEGRFYLDRLGSDWVIQRHIIREQGLVVAGPDPRPLIDPVAPDDLRLAVRGFLREWWAPMLDAPDPRLHGGAYQAYAILTMCRALYTLAHGAVVSKTAAAGWAREALDGRWIALIAWALAWPDDTRIAGMREVLGFIRYTLERWARSL